MPGLKKTVNIQNNSAEDTNILTFMINFYFGLTTNVKCSIVIGRIYTWKTGKEKGGIKKG